MNCYQAKAGELAKQWYVIDASGQVVGRLAAQIAPILMGKHRPTYTPHIDTGDYVIVTNVDKVVFTGNKWQEKSYQRYSGYPGGQREETAWKLFQRHPERILQLAIQRMMPKSKLGRHMMDKLKLYVGADHPHQAQRPVPLEPLSGRPASAGALFAPPPTPPGARKMAKAIAELEEKRQELAASEQASAVGEREEAALAAEQERAAPPVENQIDAATVANEPATTAAEDEPTVAAATLAETSDSTPKVADQFQDETVSTGGEVGSPSKPETKVAASGAAPAEPASPE